MTITTLSSREFDRDTSSAKKAARSNPVFVTERGRITHVLLSIKEYEKLAGGRPSIVELLTMPGGGAIDFDPPRIGVGLHGGG